MTVEHRLVFGLADIKAVTFACKKCNARLSVAPDKPPIPRLGKCPACNEEWLSTHPTVSGSQMDAVLRLVSALSISLRNGEHELRGVQVLFEFDEPPR